MVREFKQDTDYKKSDMTRQRTYKIFAIFIKSCAYYL